MTGRSIMVLVTASEIIVAMLIMHAISVIKSEYRLFLV